MNSFYLQYALFSFKTLSVVVLVMKNVRNKFYKLFILKNYSSTYNSFLTSICRNIQILRVLVADKGKQFFYAVYKTWKTVTPVILKSIKAIDVREELKLIAIWCVFIITMGLGGIGKICIDTPHYLLYGSAMFYITLIHIALRK